MRKSGTGKTHIFKKAHRYIFSLSLSQVNLTSSCVNQLYINNSKSYTLDKTQLSIIVIIESCDKHFFDEPDIEVGKPIQCHVAVNHVVQLTEEEKAQARQDAIRKYQEEELLKIRTRNKPKVSPKEDTQSSPSLFDFAL